MAVGHLATRLCWTPTVLFGFVPLWLWLMVFLESPNYDRTDCASSENQKPHKHAEEAFF